MCRMVPSKDRGAVPCTDLTDQECYGGLARIAQVCKAQKSATPNALCLDAGDSFSGSYWTDVDTDSTYLKAMNTFVDAYVIGNHDFDKGSALICSDTSAPACTDTVPLSRATPVSYFLMAGRYIWYR